MKSNLFKCADADLDLSVSLSLYLGECVCVCCTKFVFMPVILSDSYSTTKGEKERSGNRKFQRRITWAMVKFQTQ